MPVSDRDRWIFIRKTLTQESDMDEFFGGEYDKLCADRRVESFSISSTHSISLKTRVFWNVYARQFYLGLYEIHVSFGMLSADVKKSSMSFNIVCFESGRHNESKSLTYVAVGSPGGFCFGDRKDLVCQYIRQGELFALFMTTLECLWYVNSSDEGAFAENFRLVRADGTVKKKDQTAT